LGSFDSFLILTPETKKTGTCISVNEKCRSETGSIKYGTKDAILTSPKEAKTFYNIYLHLNQNLPDGSLYRVFLWRVGQMPADLLLQVIETKKKNPG
jgi:hypothetical protein